MAPIAGRIRGLAALAALAAFGSACWAGIAAAQIKLIFATDNSSTSTASVGVYHPWADRINEQGKGLVDIDVRDGFTLVNQSNAYPRVLDDVVQISITLFAFVGGQFPLTEFASLPFEANDAEDASVAMARLYKTGILDSEFGEIQPLVLLVGGQQGLQLAKEPKSLDTIRGLKIITPGKIAGYTVAALGGSPLTVAPSDLYTAIQRGAADGALYPISAFRALKIGEVTSFHVDAPMGSAAGAIFMSKKKYAALPAEVRKIIDDNSGEAESRIYGHHEDMEEQQQKDQLAVTPGHKVVQLTPQQRALWQQRLAVVETQWENETPGGQEVLAKFREILAEVRAGH